VLQLGDAIHPLCLLDTMALSELAKQPSTLADFLVWAADNDPPWIPAFTVYSVMELRQSPGVFERFLELFRPLPCVLLKSYAHLLEEEVASYPDPSRIDPVAIAFTPLGGTGNDLASLPRLMDAPNIARGEAGWNAGRQEIVDGMLSLVDNYRPKAAKYTDAEVARFVWMTTYSQLVRHEHEFAVAKSEQNEAVEVDAFPSLKAMTFTVFHKFYADKTRAASISDAYDILISAALPYVEAIVTERHLADCLRKTKRRDAFLEHLDVRTLRDLRAGLSV
jgi:hypothetical protein